jgi:hypothetical protein
LIEFLILLATCNNEVMTAPNQEATNVGPWSGLCIHSSCLLVFLFFVVPFPSVLFYFLFYLIFPSLLFILLYCFLEYFYTPSSLSVIFFYFFFVCWVSNWVPRNIRVLYVLFILVYNILFANILFISLINVKNGSGTKKFSS